VKRTLRRNRQEFWYSLYEGFETIKNEHGHEIGQKVKYSNPVQAFANISAARGESEAAVFGISIQYDKSMVFAKDEYPIDETTVLFIDTKPELNPDESTDTKHDYVVTCIATSLKYTTVAMSRVDVS